MKILFINGENKKNGLVQQAFSVMQKICKEDDIEYDTVWIDEHHDHPCTACGKCIKRRKCIFDGVNEIADKADEYSGLIAGGSVLYGSLNQEMISFMERLTRSANDRFAYKVGASLLSVRKGSTEDAYKKLNHFMSLSNMVVLSNQDCGFLLGNEEGNLSETDETRITSIMENVIWIMKAIKLAEENKIIHSLNPVVKITDFMR